MSGVILPEGFAYLICKRITPTINGTHIANVEYDKKTNIHL